MQPFQSILLVSGGGALLERGLKLARKGGRRLTLMDLRDLDAEGVPHIVHSWLRLEVGLAG